MTAELDERIPAPAPTMPASPFARDLEEVVERVFSRVIEHVDASNAEVKSALKHMLSEMFDMKRDIEHIKIRVSAHDTQIAALMVAMTRPLAKPAVKRKVKRRAARAR